MDQKQLEELTSRKTQLYLYQKAIEDCGILEATQELSEKVDLKIWSKLFLISLLHQKATPATLISAISTYFKEVQDASNFLEYAIQEQFLSYSKGFIYPNITLPPSIQEQINQLGFPLPLIEEPSLITNNYQTGYHLHKGSILQGGAKIEEDVNLDHINTLNQIPLTYLSEIASRIPQLPPSDPEAYKTHLKFIKYVSYSRQLLTDTIYLTHGYDRRGRTYARGYHYNYQGCDHNKATLTFAHKEKLNE